MLNKVFNQKNMMSLKSRMISRAGGNPIGISARNFSSVFGGAEGSTVSIKKILIINFYFFRAHHLSVITLLLITSTTPSSSAQEVPD